MENKSCPDCGSQQWSVADRNYLKLFSTCWSCDKARWSRGELTLVEFERREKQATQSSNTL